MDDKGILQDSYSKLFNYFYGCELVQRITGEGVTGGWLLGQFVPQEGTDYVPGGADQSA